jgi:sterol desaturase/sphingolipid hydroxylase (fatty acid hydroxylase superfamily)
MYAALLLINAADDGWLHLRSDGWWFLFSLIVLIMVIDLWSYLVHRASHKFPVLWAMHSLHHSAEALSAITGARHFWLEELLISAGFGSVREVQQKPPARMVMVCG